MNGPPAPATLGSRDCLRKGEVTALELTITRDFTAPGIGSAVVWDWEVFLPFYFSEF